MKVTTARDMIAYLAQFDPDTAVYFECSDDTYSGLPRLDDVGVRVAPIYLANGFHVSRNGKRDYWERWSVREDGGEIDSRPAVIFMVE